MTEGNARGATEGSARGATEGSARGATEGSARGAGISTFSKEIPVSSYRRNRNDKSERQDNIVSG